jgi:hypothetical protein
MLSELRERHGRITRTEFEAALFLLRPEGREEAFLRAHADELHGVVLLGRHLAPYEDGSSEQKAGLRGDELAKAVRTAGIAHVHDPDTAVIPMLRGESADMAFGRASLMGCARAMPTPLLAQDLDSKELRSDLVVATLARQPEATFRAAPYFRFDSLSDPWLSANLNLARLTHELIGFDPIAVFVQVGLDALRSGVLARAAVQYRDALSAGALAFLQVAGFDAERAEPQDYLDYLQAVDAWRASGFDVVADRVGRFGVTAVAAGACATASGTRVSRSVPDLTRTAHRRGGSTRYWTPLRGDRLLVQDARARQQRGSLEPCPVDGCRALEDKAPIERLREHNIHLTLEELMAARSDPAALAESLRQSPIGFARDWGEALSATIELRAQA